ncbi:response regulator [Cytophaga hutchinsonii]|nr:response regulator [Cytophaga hutchinsonii]SFX23461.1 Response regulator receiver domain-containing protein [Cytophaga hutchinsonii ATCC 33406]
MNDSDITIYVVEDNEIYSLILSNELMTKTDFCINVFSSGEDMIKNIEEGKKPHIIISDYNLSLQGELKTAVELIEKLNTIDLMIPVIILTSKDDIKTAIEILKKGAFDFVIKNDNAFYQILSSIKKVADLLKLKEEIRIQKLKRSKDIKRMALLFALTTIGFITLLLLK